MSSQSLVVFDNCVLGTAAELETFWILRCEESNSYFSASSFCCIFLFYLFLVDDADMGTRKVIHRTGIPLLLTHISQALQASSTTPSPFHRMVWQTGVSSYRHGCLRPYRGGMDPKGGVQPITDDRRCWTTPGVYSK